MNADEVKNERLEGQLARPQRLTTADLARAGEAVSQRESMPVAAGEHAEDAAPPLFPAQVTDELRSRWGEIQAGFVDTPREAVEHADELVADAIKRLAESFSDETFATRRSAMVAQSRRLN